MDLEIQQNAFAQLAAAVQDTAMAAIKEMEARENVKVLALLSHHDGIFWSKGDWSKLPTKLDYGFGLELIYVKKEKVPRPLKPGSKTKRHYPGIAPDMRAALKEHNVSMRASALHNFTEGLKRPLKLAHFNTAEQGWKPDWKQRLWNSKLRIRTLSSPAVFAQVPGCIDGLRAIFLETYRPIEVADAFINWDPHGEAQRNVLGRPDHLLVTQDGKNIGRKVDVPYAFEGLEEILYLHDVRQNQKPVLVKPLFELCNLATLPDFVRENLNALYDVWDMQGYVDERDNAVLLREETRQYLEDDRMVWADPDSTENPLVNIHDAIKAFEADPDRVVEVNKQCDDLYQGWVKQAFG